MSSAHIGWRNIDKFLPAQGFQHVIGAEAIAEKLPGTQSGNWGMFDEYLFDYLYDYLTEKSPDTPAYVIAITGDHNARGIVGYPDSHKWQQYGVPLIFLLPESCSRARKTDAVDDKNGFALLANDSLAMQWTSGQRIDLSRGVDPGSFAEAKRKAQAYLGCMAWLMYNDLRSSR